MLIIEPGTQFLLTQKLNNPSDSNTYYVQAKVYNAVSGALLNTVNLTDNGSKFFSKLWTAPTDGTTNGLQVYVLYTAYTDSAYTVESTIYGTNVEVYMVRHLPTTNLGGFTTEGARVDYSAIEKTVRKVIGEIPKAKEAKPYDDSVLVSLVESLENKIESYRNENDGKSAKAMEDIIEKIEERLGVHSDEMSEKVETLKNHFASIHASSEEGHTRRTMELHGRINSLEDALENHKKDIADSFGAFREDAKRQFSTPVELRIVQKLADEKTPVEQSDEDKKRERQKMTLDKLLSL